MRPEKLLEILTQLMLQQNEMSVEQWQIRVVDTISEYICADKANFITQLDSGPPVQLTRNTSIKNNKAYLDYFYALDPLGFIADGITGLELAHGPKFRKNVVSLQEVIDPSQLRKSEYYNDFLKPQKIRHETIVYLKSGKRILGILSLMRQTSRDFSSDINKLLHCLSPYLTAILETIYSRRKIQTLNQAMNVFEEQCDVGLMIVGVDMNERFRNSHATKIWAGLETSSGYELPKSIEEHCRILRRHNETAGERSTGRSGFCRFNLGDQSIAAEIRYFQPNDTPSKHDFFTIIMGTTQRPCFNLQKIQSHFGLSKREADVIDGIFRGLKNTQIADELFINVTTVKKHIQNICNKMGLKSRTAIIYSILNTLGII